MFRCLLPWRCNRRVDSLDRTHCSLNFVPDEVYRYERYLEELFLDANQIKDLPRPFFRLYNIKRLGISDNEIARLPPEIGNLASLQEFDISRNDICDIPENIKYCKSLQSLDLSGNPISKLPDGFSQLQNLTSLCLNDVSLIRLPPDIGSLTELQVLEARENLIKFLPVSLAFLTKLERLDLGCNELEELPDVIGSLPSLAELWLDGNLLKSLPPEIGNLKKLQIFDASENKIEYLPDEICFCAALTDLHLSQNFLEDLPDTIGKLKKLQLLKVDQNRLISLTPAIGGSIGLTELILTENLLEEIPTTVGKLHKLSLLNVDRNRLVVLPVEIGNCTKLTVLSLRDNLLQRLPSEIGNCRNLHVVDVSGNRLDFLPLSVGTLPLSALWLSENQSQPVLKLQTDEDEQSNGKVLTCFLLPQQGMGSLEMLTNDLSHGIAFENLMMQDYKDEEEEELPPKEGGIMFADDNDPKHDRETSQFERHDTPRFKDLKARHPKRVIHKPHPDGTGRHGRSFTDEESASDSDSARQKKHSFDEKVTENKPVEEDITDFVSTPPRKGVGFASDDVTPPRKGVGFANDEDTPPRIGDGFASDDVTPPRKGVGFANDEDTPPRIGVGFANDNDTPPRIGVGFANDDDTPPRIGVGFANDGDTPPRIGVGFANDDDTPPRIGIGFANDDEEDGARKGETDEDHDPKIRFEGEDHPERHDKLRRRDTPHYLKDKRINLKDDDEEKVKEIMAKAPVDGSDGELEAGSGSENEEGPKLKRKLFENETEPNEYEEQHMVTVTKVIEEIEYTLHRDTKGLGINIAGGKGSTPYKENDEAIFISKISENGPAGKEKILQVGDKILKVNDTDISKATHHEAVNVLKSTGKNITLFVVREREEIVKKPLQKQTPEIVQEEIPVQEINGEHKEPELESMPDEVEEAEKEETKKVGVRFAPEPEMEEIETKPERVTVTLKRGGDKGLGFSIAGGRGSTPFKDGDPGIFISKLAEEGIAEKDGRLKLGDKILSINSKDMRSCRHEDAVGMLTGGLSYVTLIVYREKVVNKRMTPLSKLQDQSSVNKKLLIKNEEVVNHLENGKDLDLEDSTPAPNIDEVILKKGSNPLGFSIVGGCDHASHPFGIDEPGVFISKIVPNGVADSTGLKIGDRILKVNGKDMRSSTHQEAVAALIANVSLIKLLVRHDPPPKGLQDITFMKSPGDKLGISIRGGAKGHPGNPFDKTDEGIFISKVTEGAAAYKDGRLQVGQRILEVNGTSLLGATHLEAVRALRSMGDKLTLLVCDGYDPTKVPEVLPGQMPIMSLNAGRSVSEESIDRDPPTHERAQEEIRKEIRRQEEESRKESEKFEKEEAERKEAIRKRMEEAKHLDDEDSKSPNRVSPGLVSQEQARRLEAEEAEKQVKDRIQLRQANKENTDSDVKESTTTNAKRTLSASEKRAIEAEKRALWRKERMRELEEDALKAQIVIAQVKAMSASSLESLPLGSPDGPRKSSSSENEFTEGGLRRTSSSGTSTKTT